MSDAGGESEAAAEDDHSSLDPWAEVQAGVDRAKRATIWRFTVPGFVMIVAGALLMPTGVPRLQIIAASALVIAGGLYVGTGVTIGSIVTAMVSIVRSAIDDTYESGSQQPATKAGLLRRLNDGFQTYPDLVDGIQKLAIIPLLGVLATAAAGIAVALFNR